MEASEFLSNLFAPTDLIEFRMLPGAYSKWCAASDAAGMVDALNKDNATGRNIYFGVNPRKAQGGRSLADVALARCVFIDIDKMTDLDFAQSVVQDAGLPKPTFVVFSGGGLHFYWMLDEPITDLSLIHI